MNTTSIIPIRHGDIEYMTNPPQGLIKINPGTFYGRNGGVQLSPLGRRQLYGLGQSLQRRDIQLDVILTSPVLRAIQSAEELQQTFKNANIVLDEHFIEVGIPSLIGHPILPLRNDLKNQGYDEYSKQYVTEYGHESRGQITHRMALGYTEAEQKYPGKTIGIISHGDPLAFLGYYLDNRSTIDLDDPKLLSQYEERVPAVGMLPALYNLNKGEGWIINELHFNESERIKADITSHKERA